MKFIKKIAAILLVCVIALSFAGCEKLIKAFEDEEIRKNTEGMIDSIIADDFEGAYSFIDETCSEVDFSLIFDQIKEMLGDVETYKLTILSAYKNASIKAGEAVTTCDASYKLETSSGVYVIETKRILPQTDLAAFYIAPYEKTNYYSTGSLENMTKASAFQWIMLLSNLLIIAVIIYALVDCCKKKIKSKAFWIIFILLGIVAFGVTLTQGEINLNFNIAWLFAYTAHITYGGGMFVTRFMLPLGAIVYLIVRKTIIIKPQESEVVPEIESVDSPEEETQTPEENKPLNEKENL